MDWILANRGPISTNHGHCLKQQDILCKDLQLSIGCNDEFLYDQVVVGVFSLKKNEFTCNLFGSKKYFG